MGSTWSEFNQAQDEDAETPSSPIKSSLSYSQDKEIAIWSLDIPKLSLSRLLSESNVFTHQNPTSDTNPSTAETLYYAFLKEGYIFIEIDDEQLFSKLEKLTKSGEKFFQFQTQNIKTQLSNPTSKNRGYHSPSYREHITLSKEDQGVIPDQQLTEDEPRPSAQSEVTSLPVPLSFDLRSSQLMPISQDNCGYTWPKYPADFTSTFNEAFAPLFEISWKIFTQVYSLKNEMTDTMLDLKSALGIKSSIQLSHYLPPQLTQPHDPCLDSNRVLLANGARRIYPQLNIPVEELKIVESAHTLPSILSLYLVSEGLQVFDKNVRAWVDIGNVEKRGFVVTIGRKANMFFSSEEMESTPTRVVLKCGREAFGCNFCLDLE